MDTGAYGSYPGYLSRKRFRSYKKTNRRVGYKRPNPINHYTYKKNNVAKYTKTARQSIKVTYLDKIQLQSATPTRYVFSTSNAPYLNLTAILSTSTEFTNRANQYSYYMINGIAVKYARRWLDPIAYGVNGVSPGITAVTYGNGFPSVATNFYPNLINTDAGASAELADSSWDTSPFITGIRSHYQPFPKNFTTGTNSNGLGVWNASNQVANLPGELALYNDAGAATATTFNFDVWDVEIEVYCSWCNNTGG